MKKGFWKLVVGALVALLLMGMVIRSVLAGPQSIPNEKDIQRSQRVAVPKNGPDERSDMPQGNFVAGNGIVEPADRETKVSSDVAGRIARIFVKEGDHVELGAPLAELDFATQKAALDAAEGDLAGARADLLRTARGLRKEDVDSIVADTDSLEARSDLSQSSLVRTEKLAQTGAATPDELDRARQQAASDKAAYQSAQAKRHAALAGSRSEDITAAQARVMAAQARRDQAKATLEQLTIRAPIAGEILQLKYRAGEYYTPQGTDPLVIMGDTSKLRVRVDVDERDIAKVKLGARALVTLNAYPGRRVEAKVVEIGSHMGRKNVRTDDPTERIDTKILEVVIELDDKQGLVPGLRVVAYLDAA